MFVVSYYEWSLVWALLAWAGSKVIPWQNWRAKARVMAFVLLAVSFSGLLVDLGWSDQWREPCFLLGGVSVILSYVLFQSHPRGAVVLRCSSLLLMVPHLVEAVRVLVK